MRITVPQSQLDAALRIVGRAVAPRSTVPVTAHVLLQTRDGKLKLAATNLDLAIATLIDADIAEEGAVSVPARIVGDLVGSLPDAPVALRRGAAPDLTITAPRFEANVKGLDASEFPAIEAPDAEVRYIVGAAGLRRAIDDVIFATAKDQTRPQLSGVLLRAAGSQLTLVACDGFRLSVRTVALAAPAAEGCADLIVPRATLLEVARGFGPLDANVAIAATPAGHQVAFATPTLQMISRVIDGDYVDYRRVVDQTELHDVTITAAAAEVQRAARFSQIVARDDNNHLRLEATADAERRLVFQATAAQVGENSTELSATIEGPAITLGLDSTYVADALSAIRTDRLVISAAAGATRPVLFRPEPEGDIRHFIMPIVLAER